MNTITNAGLVLLNSYVPMLFERLGLINDRSAFTDDNARIKAVQYLQVLVTGESAADDNLLPLNKLLCNMQLTQPVPFEIEIGVAESHLIEGLISAAISLCPDSGSSSIPGFRGNWLLREGLLTETKEHWELKSGSRKKITTGSVAG